MTCNVGFFPCLAYTRNYDYRNDDPCCRLVIQHLKIWIGDHVHFVGMDFYKETNTLPWFTYFAKGKDNERE